MAYDEALPAWRACPPGPNSAPSNSIGWANPDRLAPAPPPDSTRNRRRSHVRQARSARQIFPALAPQAIANMAAGRRRAADRSPRVRDAARFLRQRIAGWLARGRARENQAEPN